MKIHSRDVVVKNSIEFVHVNNDRFIWSAIEVVIRHNGEDDMYYGESTNGQGRHSIFGRLAIYFAGTR